MVKFGCQVAGQYMNHPKEFTKTSPNCITKWVLKECQHSPHAQLLLVLEQIKSSSPSKGCSRVLKLQNLLMQTSLIIFLQTKVRGAVRIIISWAFKNSSNYSTTLTFNRQLEYRQHLLFLPSLEVFFSFFQFLEAKYPATKVRPKILAQVLSCLSI